MLGLEPERLDLATHRDVAQQRCESRGQVETAWRSLRRRAGLLGHPFDSRKADGKPELSKRQATVRRGSKVGLLHVVAKSGERGFEQVAKQLFAVRRRILPPQLIDAARVGEKPAEPQRVGGRERSAVDHGEEVRGLVRKVRPRGDRARHSSGRIERRAGDEAIERVVLAHRCDERP